MSLFGKIFGSGGKGGKAPTPQEAIQRLRETEEMLAKKQDFLEKKIEQELLTAKKNGTKNKRAALQALKRKKRYEKQLAQIDGTLSTIEFQREALENANTNTEVLKNMGFAAKAMKAAHENMYERSSGSISKESFVISSFFLFIFFTFPRMFCHETLFPHFASPSLFPSIIPPFPLFFRFVPSDSFIVKRVCCSLLLGSVHGCRMYNYIYLLTFTCHL